MSGALDVAEEVVEGIKDYFDGSLSALLLYKSERAQYDDIAAETSERLSDVYGPEHLVRLFCGSLYEDMALSFIDYYCRQLFICVAECILVSFLLCMSHVCLQPNSRLCLSAAAWTSASRLRLRPILLTSAHS